MSMSIISFLPYYCKLRVLVMLGLHHPHASLSFDWRWRHWQRMQSMQIKVAKLRPSMVFRNDMGRICKLLLS